MNVLVTGNLGYIGSVLTDLILDEGHNVIGLDNNYFKNCNFIKKKNNFKQIFRDIREIEEQDLDDVDSIIHLAGLSNDPLGEFNENITMDINYKSTIKLAKIAKKKGVKRFIYASTQSLYGISKTTKEISENGSHINPITAYALSKWKSENALILLSEEKFSVTILRPSTVFGASPRLRCDIVFNNLIACAYTTRKVEILTDGSPWRPVIHIKDLSKAFLICITAPLSKVKSQIFNVGSHEGNFTVKDLANIVQKKVKNSKVVYLNNHSDPRSYKVSFKKIFTKLSGLYEPKWTLEAGADELLEFFKKNNFKEKDFRGHKSNRLKNLNKLIESKKINHKLKWI